MPITVKEAFELLVLFERLTAVKHEIKKPGLGKVQSRLPSLLADIGAFNRQGR